MEMCSRRLRVLMLLCIPAFTAQAGLAPDAHPSLPAPASAVEHPPSVPAPAQGIPVPSAGVPEATETATETHKTRKWRFGVIAAYGQSDGNVRVGLAGVAVYPDRQWALGHHGLLAPCVELTASYWEGDEGHTGVTSLHAAGITALARYQGRRRPGRFIHPFVDVGFGMHFLTETEIENKELGRHWQAGSNVGAGVLLGRGEHLEIGLRIRHLSNAGTDEVNWGVNQILGRLALRF